MGRPLARMEQKVAGLHSGIRNMMGYLVTMADSACWKTEPEEIVFVGADEFDCVILVMKWSYCDRGKAPQKRLSLLPT
jgi:hypothetical protein